MPSSASISRQPRAMALAAGGRPRALRCSPARRSDFELRLRPCRALRARARAASSRASSATTPRAQALRRARARVRVSSISAAISREHPLARRAARVRYRRSSMPEPRFCGIAFGSERRRAFAQIARRARVAGSAAASAAAMLLADAGEFALRGGRVRRRHAPHRARRARTRARILARGCSRARRSAADARARLRDRACVRSTSPASARSLGTQRHQRRFDCAPTLARGVAGHEWRRRRGRAPRAAARSAASSFARSSRERFAQAAAWKRRERIERSRTKRPPVIAPPPVICSPPSVTIVSRTPRPRASSMPVSSVVTISTLPTRKLTMPANCGAVRTSVCA